MLMDIDMPDPKVDEVQIRTGISVISAGTERWAVTNEFTWSETPFPCVPGYQRVGVITKLGSGVTGLQIGQRVLATNGAWEGGVRPFWGSHIALANSPGQEVYPLSDHVDSVDAAGCVVAQVGYNAASRIRMQVDDWVVVYGDGIIGQCAAQAARARGARTILVGHREERLRLAAGHCADFVINSHHGNVIQTVSEITRRMQATAVIDTVQNERVQQEYTPLLEHAVGQVVYSGFTPGKTWADMASLQQHEFTCHFVSGWNRSRMEAALKLMEQGKMRIRPLVTHFCSYQEGPEVYRMVLENNQPFLGVAIEWGEDRL